VELELEFSSFLSNDGVLIDHFSSIYSQFFFPCKGTDVATGKSYIAQSSFDQNWGMRLAAC